MAVTRQNLKDVKAGIEPHLEQLAEKLGLQLKWGRAGYGESGYLRIDIATLSAEGRAITPEVLAFESYCACIGLEKEDLWGVFNTPDGKSYQIVGYNPRATAMPLLCKNMADGKTYKFRVDSFKRNPPKIVRAAEPSGV